MQDSNKKTDLAKLLEQLHDPVRLRVVVTGIMLAVGYAAIYMPLSDRIEDTTRKLNEAHKRQALGNDIQYLQAEVDKFQARLPADDNGAKTDSNEWVQYMLGGIRKFPAKLITLDLDDPQTVGPYRAVVFHIELAGEFYELDAFLHWLETNQRLFRVDSAKTAPARGQEDGLILQLTLLGLKG